MFFCPDCHVSNRTDAKFCRKCGKSRSELERSGKGVALVESPAPQENASIATEVASAQIESAPVLEPATSYEDVSSVGIRAKKDVEEISAADSKILEVAEEASGSNSKIVEVAEEVSGAGTELVDSVTVASKNGAVPDSTHSLSEVAVVSGDADETLHKAGAQSRGDSNLSVTIEEEISVNAQPDLNTPECPSCWKALRATDKFCCWCGEAQPNRVLPFLKLCLECSTFLPEKANYCYSCGTDVGYSSRRKVKVPHELFKDEESEFFPRFDA